MEWLDPKLIWFLVGLILLLLELVTPGLVIVFFGVGAMLTGLLTLFLPIGLNVQLVIFLFTSLITLFLLRKYVTRFFKGHVTDKQSADILLDDFVGQQVEVSEEIVPGKKGKVIFHGTIYEAESDEKLIVGQMGLILSKNSIVLKVKAI